MSTIQDILDQDIITTQDTTGVIAHTEQGTIMDTTHTTNTVSLTQLVMAIRTDIAITKAYK